VEDGSAPSATLPATMTPMDNEPQDLRARAVELYALARQIRDEAPAHAAVLVEEVNEPEKRARAIEKPGKVPPPKHSSRKVATSRAPTGPPPN
jgi:hypothetical protein